MKWRGRQQSSNVNDQRGRRAVGGRGMAVGGGGIGVIIALIYFLMTGDAGLLGAQTPSAPQAPQQAYHETSELESQLFEYAGVALKDIEDTWNTVLPQEGYRYEEPTLTIYTDSVDTGCGSATSGVGPFYCTRTATST